MKKCLTPNNKTHPKGVDELSQNVVAQENVAMTSNARQPLGCRQCAIRLVSLCDNVRYI
jgi:hypothetical protein